MPTKINIVNPEVFIKTFSTFPKVNVEGVRVEINQDGAKILAKNAIARMKMTTNSITSEDPVAFCVGDIPKFVKTIETGTNKLAEDEKLKMSVSKSCIRFSTKSFKSKFTLVKEDVVIKYLDKEITSNIEEQCRMRTTTANIDELNKASFIFSDQSLARIYLFVDEDNPGKLKAELNNRNNPFSNSITVDFGQVLSGSFEKEITLDFNRLNMFNTFDDYEDIDIIIPKMSALSCSQKIEDGDTFAKLWVVSSVMK